MKNIIILSLLAVIISCSNSDTERHSTDTPSNIIFLIGDGMGLSAVSTTVYYGDKVSEFGRFKQIGLSITSSATHKVTDSGASATAMAAGVKTYNGAIGVDTAGVSVKNIVETVSELGWNTGVISTSSVTHATPASFYAHVVQRAMEEEIATQLVNSEIDFFAGGGLDFFNKRRDRTDLFSVAGEKGFIIDTLALPKSGFLSPDHKYGFLLAGVGMPSMPGRRGDFLPDATTLAIEYLSGKNQGFFLMVEGSQIDWAGHSNESERLISETLDFEKAIAVALDFAEKDGNTLVVVSADHETGGFTLSAEHSGSMGSSNYMNIEPSFATSTHSATLIPVFADGPRSETFRGMYQNTEIFLKMANAVSPKE